MSNLGPYQWITWASKKVGGPRRLLGVFAVGGYIVIRIMEAGGKTVYKRFKKSKGEKQEKPVNDILEYTVIREGKSNENVKFSVGDKLRILEKDGDSILIDRIGDHNSPYFVSAEFLSEISEYS